MITIPNLLVTAPNNCALIEDRDVPVVGFTQEDSRFFYDGVFNDPGYDLEFHDAKPRKSLSCVFAMQNEGRLPSSNCEHCGRKPARDDIWYGAMWDSTCAMQTPDDQPFASVTLGDWPSGNRDGIIRILKDLARRAGFKFCELREYDDETRDYTPILSGPLAVLRKGC